MPRLFAILTVLATLLACDDTGSGAPPTSTTASCPSGTQAFTDADVRINTISVASVFLIGSVDAAGSINGDAGFCMSPDGLKGRILFDAGEPTGSISWEVPEAGSYDLVGGSGATFIFEIEGATSGGFASWSATNNDYTRGAVTVEKDARGKVRVYTIGVGGLNGAGDSMILDFTANVDP